MCVLCVRGCNREGGRGKIIGYQSECSVDDCLGLVSMLQDKARKYTVGVSLRDVLVGWLSRFLS